jgi:hypothetical protein
MIALSITATMIAETIARRGQLIREGNARQAELLVQAGRGRAAARIAIDADYRGERWSAEVSGGGDADIAIAVERTSGDDTRVTVTATYPDGDPRAVRRSRVFMFTNTNVSPEE